MNTRSSKKKRPLLVHVFLAMLSAASHDAKGAEMDFIRREADNISREGSSIGRTEYAKKLSELVRSRADEDIRESDIDVLAGLMQDKDDSVRYWIAVSLGFIGKRAQRSVPALERALRDRACDHSSKTSASAIRLALTRIGAAPPDIDCSK
jgi:hypothetical protein